MRAVEQRSMGSILLRNRSAPQKHTRAGLGLQLGHAQVDSGRARFRIGGNYREQGRRALEHGNSLVAQLRRAAHKGLHGKIGDVDTSKQHVVWEQFRNFVIS